MNILNGKNTISVVSQGDNAQIKANMTVVHNILNNDIELGSEESFTGQFELAA